MCDIKTPYYVFDKVQFQYELDSLKNAIQSYWPNTIVAYSVKTNSLPYIANMLSNQQGGVFAEVVSQDEYEMVRLCGYHSSHIVCNGPVKSKEFIAQLLENHAIINLDSHAELKYVGEYAAAHKQETFGVGLRVNVDIEKYFPGESKAGEKGSRFGFCMENDELRNAVESLKKCDNVYINGLHLHVSTSTRKVEIYQWLTRLYAQLVKQYGLTQVEYFDIGGGFFGGMPNRPGWKEYLSAIADEMKQVGLTNDNVKLIIEPGVSLLAGAFSYYASVVDVKDTNRSRFVVVDGSRIHIDPFFHKTNYFYEHECAELRDNVEKQIVVGFTCLEYDDIMSLKNMPEMKIGDVIRFDKLGAYTMTLSPLFISYFPAVYVRDENGNLECVRERWTAKEFVQLSKIK